MYAKTNDDFEFSYDNYTYSLIENTYHSDISNFTGNMLVWNVYLKDNSQMNIKFNHTCDDNKLKLVLVDNTNTNVKDIYQSSMVNNLNSGNYKLILVSENKVSGEIDIEIIMNSNIELYPVYYYTK